MSEPLVSIIVPVYNTVQYLEQCVRSIMMQTHRNMDIILVDDGSTDGSGVLCDKLALEDDRITTIHMNNSGVGVARNRALDAAEGEWIAFIDSDDVVETWHIGALLSAACTEGSEITLGGYRAFDGGKFGPLVTPGEMRSPVSSRRALEMLMYQEGVDTAPWGKLYRANAFKGVRFPTLPSGEDLATVYKPILNSSKVSILKDSGYRYRKTAGSLSVSGREEAAWYIAREVSSEILRVHPDLERACNCRRLSFAFHVMAQAQDSSVLDELWNEIVVTRIGVLKDGKARRKAKVASLVSYAGRRFATAIVRHRIELNGKERNR